MRNTASIKFFDSFSQTAYQKFAQTWHSFINNFLRTSKLVKISVKNLFWRDTSLSKIPLEFYWRAVNLSKQAVRIILTEYQSVKTGPSKFLTGSSKKQFRRSIFWRTFFPSKFLSKRLLFVKKSTLFHQKFYPKKDLQLVFDPCVVIVLYVGHELISPKLKVLHSVKNMWYVMKLVWLGFGL